MIFKKLYSNINLAYIVFFIVVPEYWLSAHLGIGIFACGAWLHFLGLPWSWSWSKSCVWWWHPGG